MSDGEAHLEPCESPVCIPDSFTERFLWLPNSDDQTKPPFVYEFSDELVQEIQAAVSYAFQNTIQKEKTTSDEARMAQGITLFCPHSGGHPVIDSMVKLIARHLGVDVLVLDALELAAGEFGAIGDAGSTITSMYEIANMSSQESSESIMDLKNRRFFDALLTVRNKITNPPEQDSVPQPNRIIYLRDFGRIASVGKLLLICILRAMEHLCQSESTGASTQKPSLPPTILIFGVAGGIEIISGKENDSKFRTKWHAALRTGGRALKEIMPRLNFEFPTIPTESSCSRLSPLSAQCFLPLVYTPSELTSDHLYENPDLEKEEDELLSCESIFSIFPKNAHSEDFRSALRISIQDRTKELNEALLRLSIGKRGGLITGEISNVIFGCTDNDKSRHHFQSSFLSPVTADRIAMTALGLSKPKADSSTSDSLKLGIPPSQVVEAYETHLMNLQGWQEWIDKDEETAQQEKEDKEVPTPKEDIVSQVMSSSNLSEHEKRLLGCIVKPELLSTTFDDVCTDPKVVDALRDMVSLPLLYPNHFAQGVLARQALGGVLLYGPPGTGKTTLCRALAYECGAQMVVLKPSDIFDQWAGESEKLVSGIFKLARRLAPCVIFVDEADTLFASRSSRSDSSDWRADLLTEFLQEMDGFSSATVNKGKGIVVIGATNRPFDIDAAILRRLPRRMMIGLPDQNERKSILKIHLNGETLHDDLDFDQLAERTENYSGADLKDLCVAAALAAVKEVIGNPDWASLRKQSARISADKVKDSDNKEDEKEPSLSTPSKPRTRVITKSNFTEAIEQVFPSYSKMAQNELYKWHATHSANAKGARSRNLKE